MWRTPRAGNCTRAPIRQPSASDSRAKSLVVTFEFSLSAFRSAHANALSEGPEGHGPSRRIVVNLDGLRVRGEFGDRRRQLAVHASKSRRILQVDADRGGEGWSGPPRDWHPGGTASAIGALRLPGHAGSSP